MGRVRYAQGSLTFDVARQACEKATKRIFVETAKREHSKVMRTAPRPAYFTRTVDGREGAPEESVRPDGVITYIYPRLEIVAQFAMETLFDLSPVLSGAYRNSHTLFLNDQAVKNLEDYRPGDRVVISNFEPYARKIELGVMKMRVNGTSRVYDHASRIVAGRYSNLAKVSFTYRGIIAGAVVRGRIGNKSDLRYPAMVLSER